MSRLKMALERAKAERQESGVGADFGIGSGGGAEATEDLVPRVSQPVVTDGSAGDARQSDEAPPINYTRTKTVEISREMFHRNRIVAIDDEHPALDCIKLLRTQLFQRTRSRGWNTIQVTGFGPGEGKSMVAVNLAISIASDARQTTLLVDLNFRNPSIEQLLDLQTQNGGLKSYFLDGAPLPSLFINPGIDKLTILTAGGKITHATELLGSPRMESLIKELKGRYDDRYIIIDTPAVSLCPDPLVIAEYVDGIVLVARADRTSQESVKTAMERIPKEKVIGVVLNDAAHGELIS